MLKEGFWVSFTQKEIAYGDFLEHRLLTGCSQAALGAIPHLCTVEWNKLMPVQRKLSLTQDGLSRYIPNGLGLMSEMKYLAEGIA